ncbi:MAG: hypothetical protein AAGA54_29230 [Myxococcota bacterium]
MRRALTLASLGLFACTPDPRPDSKPAPSRRTAPMPTELPLERLPVAALRGAASPRLTPGAQGLTLSWLEPDGDAVRLRAMPWGSMQQPETVVRDAALLQNWADVPSVTASNHGWIAAWPHRTGEHGYDLRWSRRDDHGRWSAPAAVSDATEGPEFGFASWAPAPDGTLRAFWLDGRGSTTSHGGAMQLWTGTFDATGLRDRRVVDARVCDCCQTAAASTPKGPVVAYRDRDEGELRDIYVAGPGAEQRRRVGADAWRIEGCPVNGPAVAAQGSDLAVAWFSAAQERPRVRVAFASGDAAFGEGVVVDDGTPLGRVDVVWLDASSVGVVWMETVGKVAELRLRRVGIDGVRGGTMRIATTESSRRAGFPHLERDGSSLAFTWVELDGKSSTIAAARAPIAGVL